jgi:hypothetical protein
VGGFFENIGRWSELFLKVGPILICLLLLAITVTFARSASLVGKTVCLGSFVGALVFGGVAVYLYSIANPPPTPDPHQKFE